MSGKMIEEEIHCGLYGGAIAPHRWSEHDVHEQVAWRAERPRFREVDLKRLCKRRGWH